MDGAHDMGGMHGFGKVDAESQDTEPVFHSEWEKKALALSITASGLGFWNIDMGRHARERQHPVTYLQNKYYENFLSGLETLLLESGLITADELKQGRAAGPAELSVRERALSADQIRQILTGIGSYEAAPETSPQYSIGDTVRVLNVRTTGHTRAPRYIRGHVGIVHLHHGAHVFPDRSAAGERIGHHLYNVRFTPTELWGEDAKGRGAILVDLWEPYLELAS